MRIISWLFIATLVLSFVYFSNCSKLYIYDSNDLKEIQIYYYNDGYSESNSKKYKSEKILNLDTYNFEDVYIIKKSDRIRFDYLSDSYVENFPKIYEVKNSFLKRNIYEFKNYEKNFNEIKEIRINNYFVSPKVDSFIDIDLNKSEKLQIKEEFNYVTLFLLALILFLLFKQKGVNDYINLMKTYKIVHSENLYVYFYYILLFFIVLNLPFNHGPDEYTHMFSGSWYFDNILPPNDKSIIWYESHYGINYILFSQDITYLFTFKLSQLIQQFFGYGSLISLRVSQILIYFICLFFIMKKDMKFAFFLLLLPILIPQVSYLFTYYNGDLLSLVFLAYGLSVLKDKKNIDIHFVIACFLIFNLKLNYIIISIFIVIYFIYKNLKTLNFKDYLFMVLVLILSNYKKIYTLTFDKTFLQIISEHGSVERFQYLQNKVIDFSIFYNLEWYLSSMFSFFGIFGYMNYSMPYIYYCIFITLFLYLLFKILKNNKIYFMVFFLLFFLNLIASLYYSATYDVQAQGRYLFPCLVIFTYFLSRVISKKDILFLSFISGSLGMTFLIKFLLEKINV